MRRAFRWLATAGVIPMVLAGCAGGSTLPPEAGIGPNPQLPAPAHSLIPTVKIAPAKGWPRGQTPTAASGLIVRPYAKGLTHPRWLYVLPNGDVLVAETNGPAAPVKGLKDWVMKIVMKKAGAGVPSPERITLLRDVDGDGLAETRTTFLQGLHSPFGMTLVGDELYVADTDALLRFPYKTGETSISAAPVKLVDLPANPPDYHWTKNVIASRDGTKLYVTVGSNSNVGDHGMDKEVGRAAIWEVDRRSGQSRLFATGMRNPNGMGWEPQTGVLWAVANERDEIGNDLVPDYLTSVKDGAFYGWPYSYYGQHVDERAKPPRPDLVAKAVPPDYALGAHTASLGLTFSAGSRLPASYANGAFIGQHGSWNRAQLNGYKVIFVPFAAGRPSGPPRDVLTGFVDKGGHALGRPVGVVIDKSGALLVADDVGDAVWRVTGT